MTSMIEDIGRVGIESRLLYDSGNDLGMGREIRASDGCRTAAGFEECAREVFGVNEAVALVGPRKSSEVLSRALGWTS